ncbi:hypothetical protein K0M31_011782 [Melipona bicolor]|uniref:Uncharacterized protein n=1 Tax=Melipona bicolor TaxID=60889 RepID=A0AA40GAF2_9HYME|nr:hypothetical protein K0M31_011782 [Melipona bicolor]
MEAECPAGVRHNLKKPSSWWVSRAGDAKINRRRSSTGSGEREDVGSEVSLAEGERERERGTEHVLQRDIVAGNELQGNKSGNVGSEVAARGNHGTLERPESSEIAANRSPPSTGLAHSTYVQVTTRSPTFAFPSGQRIPRESRGLSDFWSIG